mmetsp:Transcript_21618/g.64452  ORF Transcript_21618/g.64452 Transcript_21618/m.64452 type:complete len:204 (-) Transcript_21618:1768-2379(-)
MLDPTAPGDGAPLGFHMIYLPYRDDMRKPQSAMAPRETAPTTEQIDAIDAVITKLTSSNFDSRKIHNPALARYNKMLETIAFDRDAYIPPEDETIVPEEEIMARAGKEIDHAVALLIPRDYDAFTAPKKRKAGSGDGPASRAKKPKVESEISTAEMRDLVTDGSWKKLTVPVLKAFCDLVNIPTARLKKAGLLEAVAEWASKA